MADETDDGELLEQPHGGALRKGGKLGNKGNVMATGRPSSAVKERAQAMLSHKQVIDAWLTILSNPDSRNWGIAMNLALRYGEGLPTQKVAVEQYGRIVHTISLPPLGATIPDAVVEEVRALPPTTPFTHPGHDPDPLEEPETLEGEDKTAGA